MLSFFRTGILLATQMDYLIYSIKLLYVSEGAYAQLETFGVNFRDYMCSVRLRQSQ